MQSIRLVDNDLSDHAFSTFGLTDPKDVSESWFGQDGTTNGYVKGFFWFLLKILTVLGKSIPKEESNLVLTSLEHKYFLKSLKNS